MPGKPIFPTTKAELRKFHRDLEKERRALRRKSLVRLAKVKSLFDPAVSQGMFKDEVFSYLQDLTLLDQTERSEQRDLRGEPRIFRSLTEDEKSFTGWLNNHHWWLGDLQYRNQHGKRVNLNHPFSVNRTGVRNWDQFQAFLKQHHLGISDWVESDNVDFQRCGARGILLVADYGMALRLVEQHFWQRENLLIISSGGLPSFLIRRLIHRLEQTYGLPTYVLANNDTWGYFFVSVLKRGMTAPHLVQPPFAVKQVRFLGLRAFDYREWGGDPKEFLIPWKPVWDHRLAAMRKMPCFQTAAWRDEFRRFKRQNGKFDLLALCYFNRRWNDFLSDKLRTKNWI